MSTTTAPTDNEIRAAFGVPDHPADGGDLATGLEAGAVEAIKRGYRTLREAVFNCFADRNADEAGAAINAVIPMQEALTGRTRDQILQSCIKRLEKDGRIERRVFAGQTYVVVHR